MWTTLSLLARNRQAHRPRGRGFRPQVEALEERWCPTGGVFEWADPTGGALDPTFGSGGQVVSSVSNYFDYGNAVVGQPDGKVVVAGLTETAGSRTGYDFLVARYNANGTLDASFGSGGYTATDFNKANDQAQAMALQPQASGPPKILAAGSAGGPQGGYVGLVRYNADGTLDTTFGTKGKVTTYVGGPGARGVTVDGSGRILVAAGTTLLRYTANGALDTTFGKGGQVATGVMVSHPECIALQADGKILVGCQQGIPSTGGAQFVLTRITANGAVDTTFGSGGAVVTHLGYYDNFNGVTVQADGKIVIAGGQGGIDPDGVDRQGAYLLRYNADGSLDGTFGAGGVAYLVKPGLFFQNSLGGVAVQSDGWIVTGATYSDPSQNNYFAVLRVSPSGALDPGYGTGGWASVTFGSGTQVEAMALQPDGRVIMAGITRRSGTTFPTDVALCRFLPAAPQIGSFTASNSTVTAGSSVTLTVANITDENPSSNVAQVAFYIMINGSPVLLGYGTHNSDGSWSYAFDTTGYASGTYTLYAQATDNYGALGNPVALTLTVQ
jgi:uncharacterized delta-60 repeat protein